MEIFWFYTALKIHFQKLFYPKLQLKDDILIWSWEVDFACSPHAKVKSALLIQHIESVYIGPDIALKLHFWKSSPPHHYTPTRLHTI